MSFFSLHTLCDSKKQNERKQHVETAKDTVIYAGKNVRMELIKKQGYVMKRYNHEFPFVIR